MDCQAGEILVLRNDELAVLLAAAGISKWYGIDIGNTSELERDSVFNRNLASLYQKRVIDWNDEKAYILDSYKQVLQVIKNSPVCIVIESADRSGYIRGSYFSGEDVVNIERRTSAEDEIELSFQNFNDWIRSLEEDGLFPETAGVPNDDEVIEASDELLSRFELRSVPDGEFIETADVYEKGVYGILRRKNQNKTEENYFTKELFENMLNIWVKVSERNGKQ